MLLQVQPTEDDAPGVYLPYNPADMEVLPRYVETEELLDGLDGVDVRQQPEAAAAADDVQVPDTRVITDYEELELIGQGLPIFQGVR